MLTREKFTKYMKILCDRTVKQEKINDITRDIEFCDIDITGHESLALELIEVIMKDNDKGSWISYWFYELERGTKWHDGCVEIGGEDVKLQTIDDLYNLLVEESYE